MWSGAAVTGTMFVYIALHGPKNTLLAELGLRDVLEEMTRDLITEYSHAPPDTDEWRVRNPPW